jgi:hypothetical protein
MLHFKLGEPYQLTRLKFGEGWVGRGQSDAHVARNFSQNNLWVSPYIRFSKYLNLVVCMYTV